MILSNPDGGGWLKFSKTASRIAPSSTGKRVHKRISISLTIEDGEDGSLDPEDGGVQVLTVTVQVELHMVVGEAEHVPFLPVEQEDHSEVGHLQPSDLVLLLPPAPDHSLAGDGPRTVVQAKILGQVGSTGTLISTLDLQFDGYSQTSNKNLLKFYN